MTDTATSKATETGAYRIVELKIENVKRIKAVSIKPENDVIEITGRNGQGKSSILDAISYALGGKDLIPAKPVRDGEDTANVVIDLGDIVVTRTWTANGNTYLYVTNKEGAKFSSPQAILDKLVGELTFDPLEFSRMKPKDQAATIKALAKLDFTGLEKQRTAYYDERMAVNRELKQVEGQLAGMPEVVAPPMETSLTDLATKLQAAQQANTNNAEARSILTNLRMDVSLSEQRIEELRHAINAEEERLHRHKREVEAQEEVCQGLVDEDLEEIKRQMATAEETNSKVRAKKQRQEVAAKVDNYKSRYKELTEQIAQVDEEKQQMLAAANLPIPGLSLSDDGVTLNGLPFEQACSSEQLKVSVAMGLALNPKLRVMLVRDASLLDSQGRAIVAEMAEKADAQVWMERATDGEPIGVVIEDGELKQIPVTAEA